VHFLSYGEEDIKMNIWLTTIQTPNNLVSKCIRFLASSIGVVCEKDKKAINYFFLNWFIDIHIHHPW